MAQATGTEYLDDGLGFGGMVRRTECHGIGRRRRIAQQAAVFEEGSQGDASESATELPKEVAAGACFNGVSGAGIGFGHGMLTSVIDTT